MTQEKETDRERFWRIFRMIAQTDNNPSSKVRPLDLFMRAARAHGGTSAMRAKRHWEAFNAECQKGKKGNPKLERYMRNYLKRLEENPPKPESPPARAAVRSAPAGRVFRESFPYSQ